MIDTLHKLAKAFDVYTAESEKLIQAYRTPLDISIIERAVKHGAAFSSEYVLQYTKDLAEPHPERGEKRSRRHHKGALRYGERACFQRCANN